MNKIACEGCGVTVVDCRRYRLEPLADYMRLSISATCIAARLAGSTQKGALCHGITRRVVDRVAGELKEHPATIWPEIVDHDIEDAQVECADPRCPVRFVPSTKTQKFCTKTCGRRARSRRWAKSRYDNDPGYRENQVQKMREYRETARRALRLSAQAYRERNREELREKAREYRARNRERLMARDRERYVQNRDEMLAKQRERDRARRARLRAERERAA